MANKSVFFGAAVALVLVLVVVADKPRVNIWPDPSSITIDSQGQTLFIPNYKNFDFKITQIHASVLPILQAAIKRYSSIIFYDDRASTDTSICSAGKKCVSSVDIQVSSDESSLTLEMDESYALQCTLTGITLSSNTIWGALRGIGM